MLEQIVQDTQFRIIKEFVDENRVSSSPSWIVSLRQISEAPDEQVKACLGDLGKKLKRFARRVNLEHPDLEIFVDNLPKCAVEIFKTSAEILNSGDVQNDELAFSLKYGDEGKVFLRAILQPRTRLLLDVSDRTNQRSVKKHPKNVGLKALLSAGENAYFGQAENFNRFARGSKIGYEELDQLDERQAKFRSMNMQEIADSYSKRMKSLQETLADYFGFHRLKPDEAAVTLARLHGFKWSENGSIVVPNKFFGEFHFWTEKDTVDSTSTDVKTEAIKKSLILNTRFAVNGSSTSNFHYQARMYPLPNFLTPPSSVREIINKVESFSALGNNPFFDYLWVLVPSININHPFLRHHKEVEEWSILNNKEEVLFSNSMEASMFLDKKLVENKIVYPIVIGERDGKCYFLAMYS